MSNTSIVTPCFSPGTRIATDRGTIPIEAVRAGTRLVTRDNGLRRVYWAGQRVVPYAELCETPQLRPILIRAGAMGEGRPFRDMLVSPTHRMLVKPDTGMLKTAEPEVLVAAEFLPGLAGVEKAQTLGVSYHHVLCDRHQVILADGAWTESFHPDDKTVLDMTPAQRKEVLSIFPEVATVGAADQFSAARQTFDVDR